MNFRKHPGPFALIAVFMLAGVFQLMSSLDLHVPDIRRVKTPDFAALFKNDDPEVDQLARLSSIIASTNRTIAQTPLVDLDGETIPDDEKDVTAQSEDTRDEEVELAVAESEPEPAPAPEPEPEPEPAPPPPPPPPAPEPEPEPVVLAGIQSRSIPDQSLTALVCHYTSQNPALTDGFAHQGKLMASGSGVIVHPNGYILTSRWIVDPQWHVENRPEELTEEEEVMTQNKTFDFCEVGFIRKNTLPSMEDVESFNYQSGTITPFPYRATVQHLPSVSGLSAEEASKLDFAILKIDGPYADCEFFNDCNLPSQFDYIPIWDGEIERHPKLIGYGFPEDDTYTTDDLLIQGRVGRISRTFTNTSLGSIPFEFNWNVERGIGKDRQSVPVLWQGHVVGINYGLKRGDFREGHAIHAATIKKILANQGVGHYLAEN